MKNYDEEELLNRARIAYRKAGNAMQPSAGACDVVETDGGVYAVLRNTNGILAVYQHKNESLSALTTWPAGIQ
jgi:hypothetical protein